MKTLFGTFTLMLLVYGNVSALADPSSSNLTNQFKGESFWCNSSNMQATAAATGGAFLNALQSCRNSGCGTCAVISVVSRIDTNGNDCAYTYSAGDNMIADVVIQGTNCNAATPPSDNPQPSTNPTPLPAMPAQATNANQPSVNCQLNYENGIWEVIRNGQMINSSLDQMTAQLQVNACNGNDF